MDVLGEVIHDMSKEEVRAFKLFAKKTDRKGGRKDLELFDYIRKKGIQYDDSALWKNLYPQSPKNAYHRLKSRLLGDVNQSLVQLNQEKNDTLKLYHLLSVIELYFQRRALDLAHYYLRKAEKLAMGLEHYEILDIIYKQYIKLAHEQVNLDPGPFIQKRQENHKRLIRLQELDNILAMVIYRVQTTQNFNASEDKVISILEQAVADFSTDLDLKQHPKLRIRLYEAIVHILLEKRDFAAMEEYLIETYSSFEQEGIFTRHTHELKLQMLSYLINSLYTTDKPRAALGFVQELGKAMEEFNQLFYAKYLPFYYNTLVLCYFKLDLDKAIDILNKVLGDNSIPLQPIQRVFMSTTLAMAWYNKAELKKALRTLIGIYIMDGFESAGDGFRLKTAVAELLLRYESEDFETLEYRLGQIRQDFSTHLQEPGFAREEALLTILEAMNVSLGISRDKPLQVRMHAFLEAENDVENRQELIDYSEFLEKYAWKGSED